MRPMNMKNATCKTQLLLTLIVAVTLWLAPAAFAAAPGITGTSAAGTTTAATFSLTAQDSYLNQPDGSAVYSWGYGCVANSTPDFVPKAPFAFAATCPTMQVPGPTMVVTEGATVTINLTNNLPTAAGNTSILFPGFIVTTSCSAATPAGAQGLLTCEAAPGATITYTFTASEAGTHPYYSGTQGDLQIEMGLYGAIIVLPSNPPAACDTTLTNLYGKADFGTTNGIPGFPEHDFRLAHAAYDHPKSCYDREYLFQWAEMDARIHKEALAQVQAKVGCVAGAPGCSLDVQTEPYHPAYFLINGRSMPDLMDPNYASEYPHQPYNGNPHMHPGEMTLIRTIGQGRWQHPFHEHANHVRILSRDGNLVLSPTNPTSSLSGLLMFNTDTTPGESFDGIFYFSGRGLNWDAFGHHPAGTTNTNTAVQADPLASVSCTPDANGYNTGNPSALNYYEWCQDHNKPVQVSPFGDVGTGGPITFPDPDVFTNGAWYGGSPYFGPDATLRASHAACDTTTNANCTDLLPSNVQANPSSERGWAFMWHSHNEREITTNNVFPGGMLMMMLVDSREFAIDESN
jgi:FtsP/CotA-like multicopper oxidase with cupredoxin domain